MEEISMSRVTALAVAGLLTVGTVAPAFAGFTQNGTNLNGTNLNGTNLNGTTPTACPLGARQPLVLVAIELAAAVVEP
jgi:hypothetical protein